MPHLHDDESNPRLPDGYAPAVSEPTEVRELDPVIVLIPEDFVVTMDDWLAGLRREPVVLPMSTAEMLAEARTEGE